MDKQIFSTMRDDINAALAAVAKKHGLKALRATGCTYGAAGFFTYKLEGTLPGGSSKAEDSYKFLLSISEGLPPLGSTFTNGARLHKIIGANTTASKVITSADGKEFVWPVETIKRFNAAKAIKS